MLTLSSSFTAEFAKAAVEPVLMVQLWTATSDPLVVCTGSKGFTLSSIHNPFTDATDAGKEVIPSVAMVSPMSVTIDPFERTIQRNTVTITFQDDGAVRELIQGTRLSHKCVIVSLGTRAIGAAADWAPVFRGLTVDLKFQNGVIDLECVDHFMYSDREYWGNWVNRHPLEVIEKILTDSGLPAALIDGDSFDPDHADHSATRHFVATYWRPDFSTETNMGLAEIWRRSAMDASVKTLCTHLAKGMTGSLITQENGIIKFIRFDTGATVRANWTEDDIFDFSQEDTVVINEIDVGVNGQYLDIADGAGPKNGNFRIKDNTSQTNYAFPGQSAGIYGKTTRFSLLDMMARYGTHGTSGFSETGTVTWRVLFPAGLSGTRVSGAWTGSTTWESMQSAGSTINSDRPLWLMIDDEVVKSVSIDMVDTGAFYVPEFSGTSGAPTTTRHVPRFADITVASANRGQLSTTAAAHDSSTESDGKVLDLTMAVDFANTQLQRFSNGCFFASATTNLSEWAVQVGDFVTVTHDRFLEFGYDGVDTSTIWEVTGKELQIDDGNAQIKWQLAYATKSSPPSVSLGYDWIKKDWIERGIADDIIYASESEVGISRCTVMGLGATSSGLVVTIGVGSAARGARAAKLHIAQDVTVLANKDHYFYMTVPNGIIGFETVTTGAAEPTFASHDIPLAKVAAGGSTCTITDYRNFGAVRPRNMSTTDFEQGANLCPNPDFETWSLGSGNPPDHWEMVTGTWGTDAIRGETEPSSGLYGIKIPNASKSLATQKFRVEADRVYQVGATVFGSASGLYIYVGVRWYTGTGSLISTTYAISQSGLHTAFARRDTPLVAPSNASYASVILLNGAQAGFGLYDAVRFVRAQPSFFVTNTTQTLGKSGNTVIDFDVEAHDTGGFFNTTLGQNKFVAPFDGIYEFKAQVLGSNLTNNHADSYLWLSKNSSELLRGTKSYTGTSSEYDYHIDSGPVRLEKGDEIQVIYNSAHTSDSVLTGSTTQNFFSGVQIQ